MAIKKVPRSGGTLPGRTTTRRDRAMELILHISKNREGFKTMLAAARVSAPSFADGPTASGAMPPGRSWKLVATGGGVMSA